MTILINRIATRRTGRARRRTLERELARVSTPADLLGLDLLNERPADDMTAEMRGILARQASQPV